MQTHEAISFHCRLAYYCHCPNIFDRLAFSSSYRFSFNSFNNVSVTLLDVLEHYRLYQLLPYRAHKETFGQLKGVKYKFLKTSQNDFKYVFRLKTFTKSRLFRVVNFWKNLIHTVFIVNVIISFIIITILIFICILKS